MKLIRPCVCIESEINGGEILKRIEKIGRVCYKSEDKITTESSSKFVANIIEKGHESVVEHISITARFIIDRGVSHELVRMRLCSFSQESTRYVNYNKRGVEFIIPCWFTTITAEGEYYFDGLEKFNGPNLDFNSDDTMYNNEKLDPNECAWVFSMLNAENTYNLLIKKGWSPQQARSVLPNSLKTEIVVTANLREWRHILKLRTSKAAHPQMIEVMNMLKTELQEKIPIVFDRI